MQIYKLNKT